MGDEHVQKLIERLGLTSGFNLLEALLNCMHTCKRTPASRFYRWQRALAARVSMSCYDPSTPELLAPGSIDVAATVLPSHLPQRPDSLFRKRCKGRRRQRQSRYRAGWILCEYLLSQYTHIHVGCPKTTSEYVHRLGDWRFTAEQNLYWQWLLSDVMRACRLKPEKGVSRGAQRVQDHIQCNLLPLATVGSDRHVSKLAKSCAFPVVTDRVKLPKVAGNILPENHLKGER